MHKRSSSSARKKRKSAEGTPAPDAPLEKKKSTATADTEDLVEPAPSPVPQIPDDQQLTLVAPLRTVMRPVAPPAMVPVAALTTTHHSFTLAGLTATIDHDKVPDMDGERQLAFIQRASQGLRFANPQNVPQILLKFTLVQTDWLIHALTICIGNLRAAVDAGLDVSLVFPRLVRWCRSGRAMARNSGQFELDVVRSSGWLACHLISSRRRPSDVNRVRVHNLCNPSHIVPVTSEDQSFNFVDADDGDDEEAPTVPEGAVDRRKLTEALVPVLTEVLNTHAAKTLKDWPTSTKIAWSEVQGIAAAVEGFIYGSGIPYTSADPTGPFFTMASYAQTLASTLESDTGDDAVLGMLANRADLIGWSGQYGKPFEVAGYHPGRPGDQEILQQVLKGMLEDAELVRSVKILIRVTGRNERSSGFIYVCPVFRAELSDADKRWKLIRTLIHEFMHRLSHPDLLEAARYVEHDQIIHEGFTDLIALHIFERLVAAAENDPVMCQSLLGPDLPFERPDEGLFTIEYDEAGAKAQQIARIVGLDGVMTAFFLGGVSFAGLRKGK
ncbi:hypothetical protein [Herbidospora mongoliensis]|uniref:hypothetical protein n=1 Tax=Herbidospora mongoliensis TaxID=688067 RepID=UPI00083410C5|nr:hypothetical protein [Herbidospora mongoliensis]